MRKFLRSLDPAAKRTLLTCFFAFFVNGLLALMIGSILPDMKAEYHLTDTQSGLILSAHSVGNLVASFLSGLVPLYLGRRRSIMCLSLLATIGFLMMTLWGNPLWLIVCFILTGMGRGSVSNFNNYTVNSVSGGNPLASNMLHSFFAVGALSAPLIFLLSGRIGGWRAALYVLVALGIISFFNYSKMRLKNDQPDRKDKKQSSLVFLKNPSFLIFAAMMFFYLCSEYSINGWLVTYLQNKESLTQSFASAAAIKTYSQTMATLLWAIILVGRLFCAFASQKVTQKKLMLIFSAGVACFFGLLLFSSNVGLVSVAVAGLGFCLAGICPMIYSDASYITNVYPMGTSVLLAIGSAGSILMPTIVGATADRFGFGGAMGTVLATIVLLVVFATLNVVVKPRLPATENAQSAGKAA